ncbi:MAG TPA: TetR/AcrR family transcriptional regulator C-terminal domain-containing protein [Acidimicrobiales bacterium]|nr:TetR/AcrR family transcriptional regulator C-terminal domain-containing protein [Acidimicrobiales bacterium]
MHGSALSAAAVERSVDARAWFEQGLEIVIAGIRASADP